MKASTVCFAIISLVACAGCAESDPGVTPGMHSNVPHDRKHHHDGDHDHSDGGTVPHSHHHSHGQPLHGGRIVSIGHTHHKDGATHFHAEVMPLVDDVIRFYLLTESDDGESVDYSTQDKEIPALMSVKGKEFLSQEVSFEPRAARDASSEFLLVIPESLAEGKTFLIVIPKITLDGQRQNFSFTISRQKSVVDKPETETSDE